MSNIIREENKFTALKKDAYEQRRQKTNTYWNAE